MTLLYCLDLYYPSIGGGELVFQKVAEAMAAEGHTVHVVTWKFKPGLKAHEIHNGVTIHRVSSPGRFFFALSAWPTLRTLARSADLIHTAIFSAAFPAYWAGRLSGIPVAITIHEIFGTLWFRFLPFIPAAISYYGEKYLLAHRFAHTLTVSRASANTIRLVSRKVADQALTVTYPGVETKDWEPTEKKQKQGHELLPTTKEGKTVVFWGRPGVSKGLEYLVEAFDYVTEPLQLVAITNKQDPRFPLIANLAQKSKQAHSIHFLEHLPFESLTAAAAAANIIAIPSITEGFGIVAAEASATGATLVVSDCASLPEAASGNIVFVKPGDPRDIARGLDAAARGETLHIAKKSFTWESCITKHKHIYETLTQSS